MGKVNLLVKYCLINNKVEYNIKGIFINNQIKFLDKENIMILDLNLNILERETKNEKIIFDFLNKICFIQDKISNNKTSFQIEIINLKNNKNYFYVKYKIDENIFEIKIEII